MVRGARCVVQVAADARGREGGRDGYEHSVPAIWCSRALFRSTVDGLVPQNPHGNLTTIFHPGREEVRRSREALRTGRLGLRGLGVSTNVLKISCRGARIGCVHAVSPCPGVQAYALAASLAWRAPPTTASERPVGHHRWGIGVLLGHDQSRQQR